MTEIKYKYLLAYEIPRKNGDVIAQQVRLLTIDDVVEALEGFNFYSPEASRNFHLYEWTAEGFKEIPIPEVES